MCVGIDTIFQQKKNPSKSTSQKSIISIRFGLNYVHLVFGVCAFIIIIVLFTQGQTIATRNKSDNADGLASSSFIFFIQLEFFDENHPQYSLTYCFTHFKLIKRWRCSNNNFILPRTPPPLSLQLTRLAIPSIFICLPLSRLLYFLSDRPEKIWSPVGMM